MSSRRDPKLVTPWRDGGQIEVAVGVGDDCHGRGDENHLSARKGFLRAEVENASGEMRPGHELEDDAANLVANGERQRAHWLTGLRVELSGDAVLAGRQVAQLEVAVGSAVRFMQTSLIVRCPHRGRGHALIGLVHDLPDEGRCLARAGVGLVSPVR